MEFRIASRVDVPAIVELLKLSLGQTLMPKSERYWQWKHIDNPFGESVVMLAIEEGQLIGVRAFLRWQFAVGAKTQYGVRAVDTAVHPGFQRKGIFGKLNAALLERSFSSGVHFLYNTPNDKSLPANLKMGSEEIGKMPVSFLCVRPVGMLFSLLNIRSGVTHVPDDDMTVYLRHPGLERLLAAQAKGMHMHTKYSVDYLWWRYVHVPVANYYACAIEQDGTLEALAFFRCKQSRIGKELRVADVFVSSPNVLSILKTRLLEKAKKHQVDYVTLSGLTVQFSGLGWFRTQLGPRVVLKMNPALVNSLVDFENWKPSLGDMELF